MNTVSTVQKCLLSISAALVIAACSQEQDTAASAPLREVRTIIVETGSGIYTRSFSGTLQSSNQTSFSFKVAGTIEDVLVEIGQSVAEDEVIATLDDSTYELEEQRSQASYAEARSKLRTAQADYDRTRKLYEAGDSSRSALDNARASSESAEAAARASQKSLEIARQNLSYTKLRSTENCKIASISSDAGENVQSGIEVISASCGEGLEVKLSIPESAIASIKKDTSVEVTFSAIPDKRFQGLVKEVGVAAIGGGTTFPVEVLIVDAEQSELRSGLSADVAFTIDNREQGKQNVPVLPSFAVGEDQNGRFVFVVIQNEAQDNVIQRVPVEIGQLQENGIEIVGGVQPGMNVVTAGVSVLRDGMKVKVSSND